MEQQRGALESHERPNSGIGKSTFEGSLFVRPELTAVAENMWQHAQRSECRSRRARNPSGDRSRLKRVVFAGLRTAGEVQMAAAFFNALVDRARAEAVTAGTDPATSAHPQVVAAMRDVGIDLLGERPQRFDSATAPGARLLVTLSGGESCPNVPGASREDWQIDDPAGQPMERVRAIRDQVRDRVEAFITARSFRRKITDVHANPFARKEAVLFLGAANSSRSQMAEALLRERAAGRFDVYSAGLKPTEVHPLTHRVLQERGLDTSSLRAKGVERFLWKLTVNHAIIVSARDAMSSPHIYPFSLETLYWPVEDPTVRHGSDPEPIATFQRVRDELDARLRVWVAKLDAHPHRT
jgi:arsenate reductase